MNKQELINYVVNSHLRNELEINELLRLIRLLPDDQELNENQQVVFEWLEAYADKDSGDWPMQTIWYFIDLAGINRLGIEDKRAFASLDRKEQFELLAAFAEWGMKNDQED